MGFSYKIYRDAQLYLSERGEPMLLEAMKLADMFARKGEIEKSHYWHEITEALQFIMMPQELAGGTIH